MPKFSGSRVILQFGAAAFAQRRRLPERSKACSGHLGDKNPPEALLTGAHCITTLFVD